MMDHFHDCTKKAAPDAANIEDGKEIYPLTLYHFLGGMSNE